MALRKKFPVVLGANEAGVVSSHQQGEINSFYIVLCVHYQNRQKKIAAPQRCNITFDTDVPESVTK
jgi:hypothetical protein